MVAPRLLAHCCGVGAGRRVRGRPAVHSAARSRAGRPVRATRRRAAFVTHRRERVQAAPSLHCGPMRVAQMHRRYVASVLPALSYLLLGVLAVGARGVAEIASFVRTATGGNATTRPPPPPKRYAAAPHIRVVPPCRMFPSAADSARWCRRAGPPAGVQARPAALGRAVSLRGVGVRVLLVPALLLTVLGAPAVRGAHGELPQHEAMVRPRCAACVVGAAIGCGSRARASCARSGSSAASPTQARPRLWLTVSASRALL